jgi:enoyl-CoA hydratase/carnithine racemase
MASFDDVVVRSQPVKGVVQLTLTRPASLNAMTAELVEGLHRALDRVAAEREARVVVLTGAGRGFCAGLDLKGYGDIEGTEGLGRVQMGLAHQKHIATLVTHMRSIPQPIIAAVNGPATGGGLALVLASDVRLAAESAIFAVSFIRVGFSACDIGTSWILPRLVGAARAQELMLTGRRFDAAEAGRIGLVVEVVPDDQLLGLAYAKAAMIMGNAPFSVTLTKEGMWKALEIPSLEAGIEFENRQQVMTSMTNDAREAKRAFMDKRAPVYTNT